MHRKMVRAADELNRAGPAALNRAGLAGKAEVLQQVRRDTGDGKLSGVGKSGGKVGARYDVAGDAVTVKMTGKAAPILERGRQNIKRGSKPIVPKKRGGKKALVTPWGPRVSVAASTTPGHHTLAHAFEQAKPRMARELRAPLVAAARKGMRA